MDTSKFEEEIGKRLQKWVQQNRVQLSWTLVFVILGHVLLYLFYLLVGGMDYAIQNFLGDLSALLWIDGIGFIGAVTYLMLYRIPAEIYYEQKQIIGERLPEQLAISIERTPDVMFTSDGKRIKAAGLLIKSREVKKIVELQALIRFEHFHYSPENEHVGQEGYDLNALLHWSGKNSPEKEIELRPDNQRVLVICEISKAKTEDGESVYLALMGSDPVPTGMCQ